MDIFSTIFSATCYLSSFIKSVVSDLPGSAAGDAAERLIPHSRPPHQRARANKKFQNAYKKLLCKFGSENLLMKKGYMSNSGYNSFNSCNSMTAKEYSAASRVP
jgi:hypothetical protein